MAYNPSNKQGNYIRAINVAATLLAQDPETLAEMPKDIATAVGHLAEELYKIQNAFFEKEGFEEAHTADSFTPKSKPSRNSSNNSKPRSSGNSGGLKTSEAQARFFKKMIREIEDAGEEPVHSYEDLENASTYDERQMWVDELKDQSNALK